MYTLGGVLLRFKISSKFFQREIKIAICLTENGK